MKTRVHIDFWIDEDVVDGALVGFENSCEGIYPELDELMDKVQTSWAQNTIDENGQPEPGTHEEQEET